MCRKYQLIGIGLLGLGIGLLIACRVSSVFWCSCFGICGIVFGVLMLQKLKA